MEVLWVSEFPPEKGAIADYSMHLTEKLVKNHDVIIDVLNEGGEQPENLSDGVRVVGAAPDDRNGWRKVFEEDYDIVNFHYYAPGMRSFVKYNLLGGHTPPKLMTVHDVPPHMKHRFLFLSFRKLAFLSEETRKKFQNEYKFLKSILRFNYFNTPYMGIESELPEKVDSINFDTDLDPSRINIVCPGFVHKKKRFDKVIDVMPDLLESLEEIKLTVAGGAYPSSDGAEERKLRETAQEKGVEDKITVTGVLPSENHVYKYIREADLVVLPFDQISQSVTLSKTIALDTVPVVTPLETLKIPIEEYGGVMMDEDTKSALVDSIFRGLQNPPNLDSAGIRNDLSWDENAKVYMQIYREITG